MKQTGWVWKVFCSQNARAALSSMGILPDVTADSTEVSSAEAASDSDFDYAHRRIGPTDIYFVRNGSSHVLRRMITFRVRAKSVERWDAVTGEINTLSEARPSANGSTSVPLELPSYGSAFIVFSKSETSVPAAMPKLQSTHPLVTHGPWTVTFQAGRGGPEKPVSVTTWRAGRIGPIRRCGISPAPQLMSHTLRRLPLRNLSEYFFTFRTFARSRALR